MKAVRKVRPRFGKNAKEGMSQGDRKEIKYVSNEDAAELVKKGWQYCGKYEYKRWLELAEKVPPRSDKA